MNRRIYLSPPHMSEIDRKLLLEAFDSNWIAPLGPNVDAFEVEVCQYIDAQAAAALSSGTAALHLALMLSNVSQGDKVLTSTFTFSATVNAIRYVGAIPVLVDSDLKTWNMDANLFEEEIERMTAAGDLPAAAVVVDLYGQCADFEPIRDICDAYDIPLIEDAAEALGASYKGKRAGTLGDLGIFSFNGNKIITTSGGGMLVSQDKEKIDRARYLATQAREPAPHYQHAEIGYNYRMSNLLAAIGRGQLQQIDERILARKNNREFYETQLASKPGIDFMPIAEYGEPNYWLTCITVNPEEANVTREDLRIAFEAANIESRPLWKPMHMQPIFAGYRVVGGNVSAELFENGLCLPSGSSLTDEDRDRIMNVIDRVLG